MVPTQRRLREHVVDERSAFVREQLPEGVFFRREELVERGLGHLRPLHHVLDRRRVVAARGEQVERRVCDPPAPSFQPCITALLDSGRNRHPYPLARAREMTIRWISLV